MPKIFNQEEIELPLLKTLIILTNIIKLIEENPKIDTCTYLTEYNCLQVPKDSRIISFSCRKTSENYGQFTIPSSAFREIKDAFRGEILFTFPQKQMSL